MPQFHPKLWMNLVNILISVRQVNVHYIYITFVRVTEIKLVISYWCRSVVVISTAQLHSTKPELRFCAGSNPAGGVSEIHDGEDL